MFFKKHDEDAAKIKKALVDYIDAQFKTTSKAAKDYLKYGDYEKAREYNGMLTAYNDILHFIVNDLK